MKTHLIKRQSIEDYVNQNSNSRLKFEKWLSLVKNAEWSKPSDIRSTFRSADILGKGSERVVYNIGGNNYRLICKYHFGKSKVHLFIKWIGAHAEYNKLCKDGMQYEINAY